MQTIEPRVHRWTAEEYYRMAGAGLFDGKRVELIQGEVIEMSPMGTSHAASVSLTAKVLEAAFGADYFARQQMPLQLDPHTETEPDVGVVTGAPRDYAEVHPDTAALIVEVAEASLNYDRTTKASLYASAGIADYWIVNLPDRQLEVYREPQPDPAQPFGYGYAAKTVLPATATVSPLAAPQASIAVADLLP